MVPQAGLGSIGRDSQNGLTCGNITQDRFLLKLNVPTTDVYRLEIAILESEIGGASMDAMLTAQLGDAISGWGLVAFGAASPTVGLLVIIVSRRQGLWVRSVRLSPVSFRVEFHAPPRVARCPGRRRLRGHRPSEGGARFTSSSFIPSPLERPPAPSCTWRTRENGTVASRCNRSD